MKRMEIPCSKEPMILKDIDTIPEPPKGGVTIKAAFCGICHSDVHMFDDELDIGGGIFLKTQDINPNVEYPIVLGHEISGTVHAIGEEADNTDLKVGDRVIVYPWLGCSDCGLCDGGQANFCCGQSNYIGCSGPNGGYSEYMKVTNPKYVLKLPDNIPLDIAAMLPCSALTGYNAVSKVKPTIERFINAKGKATLLIIGAGGLGLWCLQTAKAVLPEGTRIIISDISQPKLENALAHGADDTVLWDPSFSKEDIINKTKEKGSDGSIQAVIDFVNSAATSSRAMGVLSKGGTIAMVGLFGGSLEISLPLFAFLLQQIHGVFVGSLDQLKELVQLASNTKLKPPEISHVKLEEVPEMLAKLRRGEITGRTLVKF
uniref:alcohol dehydrogenase-like n=1 Tax=Styela clava TaxID=7725 RepID=UPI001939588E|nr:alcohol dehydrogenase-like [Styela clava]